MKSNEIKMNHIKEIKNEFGEDIFKKGVFEVSIYAKSYIADLARAAGYRKPKNAYCGIGGCYFEHLKRIEAK